MYLTWLQVAELSMSKYSALLRTQKHWWTRYKDESTRNAWRELAKLPSITFVKTPSSSVEVELSQQQVWSRNIFSLKSGLVNYVRYIFQIEYVLDELAGYAALRDTDNQW